MLQENFNFAEKQKEKSIKRALENSLEFVDLAYQIVERLAKEKETFSALDVWAVYRGPNPNHPRAMGPVFMRARNAGLIIPTNQWVKSGRGTDHNQMLRVWRSNVR